MSDAQLKALAADYAQRVEITLERWLPRGHQTPAQLHAAMRYSSLGGGKRVRPFLVYTSGAAVGLPPERLDGPACAVEMIHVYSLIHDDLPAMDNDDLRRGKPTCHRAFGEAMAILAGDALQCLAFEVLAKDPAMQATADQRLTMIATLAQASGSAGMAGGQAIDLAAVGQTLDLPALEGMHRLKTGALIEASVVLGALGSSELDSATLEALRGYARATGLAFQIRDDILDIEGDTETLGKPQGSDLAQGKPTYPALLGMDGAKRRASQLCEAALESLAGLDRRADPLRWMARYIVAREK